MRRARILGTPARTSARKPQCKQCIEANLFDPTENVVRFQGCLDATLLSSGTVTQQTRYLYAALAAAGHVPADMLVAVNAFLDDIEPLL